MAIALAQDATRECSQKIWGIAPEGAQSASPVKYGDLRERQQM
jgi:hypothetical protein